MAGKDSRPKVTAGLKFWHSVISMLLIGWGASACSAIYPTMMAQPTVNVTPDPGFGLTQFPLSKGTMWVYSYNSYEQAAGNPSRVNTATYQFTETVMDTRAVAPYYIAHIQRQQELIRADDVSLARTLATPISEWWYVVKGSQVYESRQPVDLNDIQVDELGLDFDFPLSDGKNWCPFEYVRGDPVLDCSAAGGTTVASAPSFDLPSGTLNDCYRLTEGFNGGDIHQWFCNGTGIVEEKFDHNGTSFGYLKTLIGYARGSE